MATRRKSTGVKRNKVVDRGGEEFRVFIDELTKSRGQVEFGFLEGLSSPSSADKSFWNEYGSFNVRANAMNPARPHIRPVADDNKGISRALLNAIDEGMATTKLRRQSGGQSLRGGAAVKQIRREMLEALEHMAKRLAEQVAKNIETMASPPNAASTVARKGFNDPLVETGDMLSDVAWRVRDKEGRIIAQGFARR